ncbi:MAG: ubiC transcription regulator-associated protein [Devosia sp.]|nr:ubiC transcription regulator-associated protein [Devosia sp.]
MAQDGLGATDAEGGELFSALSQEIAAAMRNGTAHEDPLYLQLARAIRGMIETGHLRYGESLPSERTLVRATGISRVTVRKAIDELFGEGLVSRRPGAGSFVARKFDQPMSVLVGFTADMRRRGLAGRSILLGKTISLPKPDELLKLALSPSDKVLRLSRVRLADDEPLAIENAVVPLFAVEPDRMEHSLYDAMRHTGNRPVRALQRLRAAVADANEARHLDIPVGSPILHIERHSFLANGKPIEVTHSAYRGDRYDFVAELHLED